MQWDHLRGHAEGERGVAIIIALVFVMVVGGLVTSGTVLLRSTQTQSEVSFRVGAQANQFARSGLTESLNWFRRQTSQPVVNFAPVLDTSADPNVLDTDEPDIGLVREFEIHGDVWGRYEVWKEWDADPDAKRLAWRKKVQVTDMSLERGYVGAGNVWRIRSIGYVFKRRDPTLAFNEKPNRVLASVVLETQIQRLALQPPGQSAVCIRRGDGATIHSNGRIVGGAAGSAIYAPTGTGNPALNAGSDVSGSPPVSYVAAVDYDDSIKAVFGVGNEELRAMADSVIITAVDFPNPVPANTMVFSDAGSLTFTTAKPLAGMSVVYVRGDVTINSGSNTNFSGLLYVDGNVTLREPAEIYGAVVVTGTLNMQGSGDFSTITFDDSVLAALRTEVGQYRWSGAIREITP